MPAKEVHFFDKHWDEGKEWYRTQFARGRGKLCGEKSPSYMTRRLFMERLHATIPEAKIVVLLRDPVSRLFSHVNHRIHRRGLPEADTIDVEYLRENILDRAWENFIERGFYLEQIEQNILRFFSGEQLFVRATDGWSASLDRRTLVHKDPHKLRGVERGDFTRRLHWELQDFLGIDRWDPPEFEIAHVRLYRAEVSPEARALARDIYRTHNDRLFEFLGYKIPSWLGD